MSPGGGIPPRWSESQGQACGSGHQVGLSGFANQAGQGGEGLQDIRQEDQGFAAEQAKDGHAFEAPIFKGGIAAFDGIAGAVIEGLPGGAAEGEVADEADGSIGKAFADVENAAKGVVIGLVGAFGWG